MIRVVRGEIEDLQAEGIVRSVSGDLTADSPFSRALELAAGPKVAERLFAMGELPVGAAVITPGGDAGTTFLIHVVLQSAEDPLRPQGLKAALRNGLRRAEEWGLERVVLPPLGVGAGKLDIEEAAEAEVEVLHEHLGRARHPAEVVILVTGAYEEEVFRRAVERRVGAPEAGGSSAEGRD